MTKRIQALLRVAAATVSIFAAGEASAIAYALEPTQQFVLQELMSIYKKLVELGNTIDGASSKQVEAAKTAAEGVNATQRQISRDEEVSRSVRRYQVAPNPCATGGAATSADAIARGSRSAAFAMQPLAFQRSGKGHGSTPEDAVAASNHDQMTSYQRAATQNKVHRSYCTENEAAVYSGTTICPSGTGARPGADVDPRSLFNGSADSAVSGLPPSMTYTPTQREDALAYFANLTADYANNLVPLPKGVMNTEAGAKYSAMLRQSRSAEALGNTPLLNEMAWHQPFSGAKDLVSALLQSSPSSAKAIYARFGETISFGDLVESETVRRFRNPDWLIQMSKANQEAVAREQLIVSAAQLEMTYQTLRVLQQVAVVQGQQYALQARTTLGPGLSSAYHEAAKARPD